MRGSDPDKYDFDENDVVVTHEKSYAAGVPAVLISLRRGLEQMGVVRTTRTLARLNQRNRIGGDQAPIPGLAKLLLDAEDRNPGTVLDREFIDRHCAASTPTPSPAAARTLAHVVGFEKAIRALL